MYQNLKLEPKNQLLSIDMIIRYFPIVIIIFTTSCSKKTIQQLLDDGFQEDGQKAVRLYTKAISKDRNNVEAYWRRGNEYYKMNEYEKAIVDFNKAITIDSAYNEGYLFGDRGLAKEALGQYSAAIEDYTTALKLCVDTFVSTPRENYYYYRARTKLKTGDTTLAIVDNDSALYYWSSFPRARFQKARLLVINGDFIKAKEYYTGLLDPSSASEKEFLEDVFYIGLLKFKTGDTTYCDYWKAAAKYKYAKAFEYLDKYCK